jgi:hypothetical protein
MFILSSEFLYGVHWQCNVLALRSVCHFEAGVFDMRVRWKKSPIPANVGYLPLQAILCVL